MADEAQYEYESHKRKYEDDASPPPPPPRRPTGFSAPIVHNKSPDADAPPSAAAYGSVPPPMDEFQLAKQRLQELASRAFNADGKRSKVDNGGYTANANVSSDQKYMASNIQSVSTASIPASHAYPGSKKIEVPNGRVGVIIGRAGETIKYLQNQSGARIQVTRDADHDPNMPNRTVELMGNPDQIEKAEQLINEVLSEASVGGPGAVSRRTTGAPGSEPFVMRVPNNKVGLVIGKGGETIKSIQARTGARVQVIPLHPPPGDTSTERTVQIDGTSEQIEAAKQMVNEIIENRLRNPAMAGGYSQQGYQAQPPNWAPQPPHQAQQPGGYGYMQQPGAYPGAPSQYGSSQPPYSGYPQQTSGGYAQNWSQAGAPQSQQASQGGGYDYYGQQPPAQQQPPANGPPNDNTSYNYSQAPSSGAYGQQGYTQDGYGSAYQAPPAQHGYGRPSSGYDQQHGYGSAAGYGTVTNPPQDGHANPYATQGEIGQVPPQQGYSGQQPSPSAAAYPTQGSNQGAGYGVPPTSQAGYGAPPAGQVGYGSTPGYGPPQGQRTPTNPPAYGQQPQQSPSSQGGGYSQPTGQQYPPSQSPAQAGYGQADAGAPRAAASGGPAYGSAPAQPGAYSSSYGNYGQQAAAYYGGAYSQPPAYPADGGAAPPPSAQPNAAAKASPQS